MTAGAFLRWLPRRLLCALVGHKWTEADGRVYSVYGPTDGYECRRCNQTTPSPLLVWQERDEPEGSE